MALKPSSLAKAGKSSQQESERTMFLARMMTTGNVGAIDRVIRAIPAIATAWLYWTSALSGPALIVAAIVSAMLLVTSLTGACSIYYMLGWSPRPVSGQKDSRGWCVHLAGNACILSAAARSRHVKRPSLPLDCAGRL